MSINKLLSCHMCIQLLTKLLKLSELAKLKVKNSLSNSYEKLNLYIHIIVAHLYISHSANTISRLPFRLYDIAPVSMLPMSGVLFFTILIVMPLVTIRV